mgnify:CR=1 FL=1
MDKKIGHYSFIVGVIIAIILGLALPLSDQITAVLTTVLVILGLVVGFLNVSGKETTEFLTVATILVIISYAGGASGNLSSVQMIGTYLKGIFNAVMALVVPAAVVVALKDVWRLGQA